MAARQRIKGAIVTSIITMRADAQTKQRLQQAAALTDTSLTQFVLTAAAEKADRVLVEHSATVVPAEFFDAFYAELERPVEADPALAAAARRPRRFRQR